MGMNLWGSQTGVSTSWGCCISHTPRSGGSKMTQITKSVGGARGVVLNWRRIGVVPALYWRRTGVVLALDQRSNGHVLALYRRWIGVVTVLDCRLTSAGLALNRCLTGIEPMPNRGRDSSECPSRLELYQKTRYAVGWYC